MDPADHQDAQQCGHQHPLHLPSFGRLSIKLPARCLCVSFRFQAGYDSLTRLDLLRKNDDALIEQTAETLLNNLLYASHHSPAVYESTAYYCDTAAGWVASREIKMEVKRGAGAAETIRPIKSCH